VIYFKPSLEHPLLIRGSHVMVCHYEGAPCIPPMCVYLSTSYACSMGTSGTSVPSPARKYNLRPYNLPLLGCVLYLLRKGCPSYTGQRRCAIEAVCRGLLWPYVRLAFRVRHCWLAFEEAQHLHRRRTRVPMGTRCPSCAVHALTMCAL